MKAGEIRYEPLYICWIQVLGKSIVNYIDLSGLPKVYIQCSGGNTASGLRSYEFCLLFCCFLMFVTLGKSFNLSEPQFPQL